MITSSHELAADCLLSLWQLTAQHQGDPAPLHRRLTHPTDALALVPALPLAAPRWLAAHPTAQPLALRVMATFASVMQLSDLGDRPGQIELAIAIYTWVLSTLPPTADPVDRATTLNNLATAYCDRSCGDPADNIEQAIQLYQRVLAMPVPTAWPVALTGLATAYRDRICGDPADNLDQAIATYEQALGTISRQQQPVAWARVSNHLAAAYGDRQCDRLASIDAAISAYRQAWVVV